MKGVPGGAYNVCVHAVHALCMPKQVSGGDEAIIQLGLLICTHLVLGTKASRIDYTAMNHNPVYCVLPLGLQM